MKRAAVLAAAALIVALVAAAVAAAAYSLSVTTSKSVITYHEPFKLAVSTPEPTATPVTVFARSVNTTGWIVLKTFSASRTAEATSLVVGNPRPRVTTAYKAVGGGIESAVVTVSVKAKLFGPVLPHSVRAGRTVVIWGHIWPRHVVGSQPIDLKVYKRVGDTWVLNQTLKPAIVGAKADGAKWKITWTPQAGDVGTWGFRASHEDTAHAYAETRMVTVHVRAVK